MPDPSPHPGHSLPPGGSHPSQPPAWLASAPVDHPPERLGRYFLGPLLGVGGMGRVFEAWDPSLKRVVALKLLHRDHPEALARFLKEAELQARVPHPAICPIYEVDLSWDHPIIAMRLIQGPSLEERPGPCEPAAAAQMMAEAAGAVHAAHLAGLVHRDLKPANFMTESRPGGPDRVFVLDFGLAREFLDETKGITLDRSGTPAYMSPEQLLADRARLGPSTDVYGLGATLFFLLTGSPPFDADSLGQRLAHPKAWMPPSPRAINHQIPEDLDTLVRRCMEADPADRYPTAYELEEDLRRWLAQLPIRARPAGPWDRLRKWIRRNPALTRVAAVGSLLVLALGGYTLRLQAKARQRQALAQHFGQETEALVGLLRVAHLHPPHDVRPERWAIVRRMEGIQAQLRALDGSSRGPALEALGKGHLALGEWAPAREALQGAWEAGHRSPEVALALGTCLGELYQQGLEEARQSLGPKGWEARRDLLRASFLKPALELLEPLKREGRLGREGLEALLAFHQGEMKEAIQKAREARAHHPTFHEAWVIEARAWMIQAENDMDAGRTAPALASLDEAGSALASALDACRSDPNLWVMEAKRFLARAEILEDQGTGAELDACFGGSLEAAGKALALDPDHVPARLQAARAAVLHGQYQREHGQDPSLSAQEAVRWAQEAIALAPKEGGGFYWLGRTHLMVAMGQDRKCRADLATLSQSTEALEQAVALGWPAEWPLAQAYRLRAKTELRSGLDPAPALHQGLAWARKAMATQVAKEPLYVASLLLLNLGDQRARNGKDPIPDLQEAVTLGEQGYQQFHDGIFLYALTHAHYQWALHLRRIGRDPGIPLDAALERARQAVAQGPRHAILHLSLGLVEMLRAHVAKDRHQPFDPRPAERAFRAALALNPTFTEVHANLARLDLLAARLNQDPSALDRAGRTLTQASRLGPDTPEVCALQAQLHRQRYGLHQDRTHLALGLETSEQALRLNPSCAHALAEHGVLTCFKGKAEKSESLSKRGREELQKALALDATLKPDYQNWVAP